jgi:hypothetical protein
MTAKQLQAFGFNAKRATGSYRVTCDQCEPCIIQGVTLSRVRVPERNVREQRLQCARLAQSALLRGLPVTRIHAFNRPPLFVVRNLLASTYWTGDTWSQHATDALHYLDYSSAQSVLDRLPANPFTVVVYLGSYN